MDSLDQLVRRILGMRCVGGRTAAPAGAPPVARVRLIDQIGPLPPIGAVPTWTAPVAPPPTRQICAENPWRSVLIIGVTLVACAVSTDPAAAVNARLVLPIGSVTIFDRATHGTIVCRAWYWFSGVGAIMAVGEQ